MSRYAFGKLFESLDDVDLEDIKGYGFFDWEAHGVVGYDAITETYFANLDGSWGVGTTIREIPTIDAFQRKLSEMFKGAELPFIESGLRQLAQGVEVRPVILTPAQAVSNKD
ncbi:hypothetical protein B1F69_00525 [Pseudomonas syringae]|uniref:hypothetical protein n=1 Tax=Pseudomonas syringae TaxID=317 RepID=UPI0004666C30|nr:hypothetical protein [Pseudomonas syringae]RXU05095.1 hypothetical protein B1F69_00525 [Pseudomonas syringae]UOF19505.1 hypothetical protein N023_23290 [Pseudomonas syringae CC440]UZA81901.1 hypothetical protein EZZ79_24280 [Pseudomonas syringae]